MMCYFGEERDGHRITTVRTLDQNKTDRAFNHAVGNVGGSQHRVLHNRGETGWDAPLYLGHPTVAASTNHLQAKDLQKYRNYFLDRRSRTSV